MGMYHHQPGQVTEDVVPWWIQCTAVVLVKLDGWWLVGSLPDTNSIIISSHRLVRKLGFSVGWIHENRRACLPGQSKKSKERGTG